MTLCNEGKAHSTIAGYRSAINSVWRTVGRPETDSVEVSRLLDSFKTDRSRSLVKAPRWDLSLVLSILTKSTYELLAQSDLKSFTVRLLPIYY